MPSGHWSIASPSFPHPEHASLAIPAGTPEHSQTPLPAGFAACSVSGSKSRLAVFGCVSQTCLHRLRGDDASAYHCIIQMYLDTLRTFNIVAVAKGKVRGKNAMLKKSTIKSRHQVHQPQSSRLFHSTQFVMFCHLNCTSLSLTHQLFVR